MDVTATDNIALHMLGFMLLRNCLTCAENGYLHFAQKENICQVLSG